MSDITNKLVSGAALMMLLRLCVKLMGLVNTMILARLLLPSDFGVVALVMSVYALIEIINAFGFDVNLIQNQKADRRHYDTSWTLKVLFGLISGSLLFILAESIADFYNDLRIIEVAHALAVMFILNGLVNIGVVDFRKNLDFKTEFGYELSIKFLTVIFTIALAYLLRNYWALVAGMIFSEAARLSLSYRLSAYRPRFDLSKVKEILGFSSWLLFSNVLVYLNIRSKELIIGRMESVKYVGIYTVADDFASMATTELVASINRATYPGYAKLKESLADLRMLYLQVLASISTFGIPASIGITLIAPLFVPLILGDKWLEAIPIMQILGLANAVFCINTNAGYIAIALGKPKYGTFSLLLRVTILLSLMFALIESMGYIGAAWAFLITSLVMFPVYFLLLRFLIGVKVFQYLAAIMRPVVASMVMFFTTSWVFGLRTPFSSGQANPEVSLLNLFAICGVGAAVYVATLVSLWFIAGRPSGPERKIFETLRSRLRPAI